MTTGYNYMVETIQIQLGWLERNVTNLLSLSGMEGRIGRKEFGPLLDLGLIWACQVKLAFDSAIQDSSFVGPICCKIKEI